MNDSDGIMWHIERDPQLRSTITSIWVLDQPPDDARFDATLARCLEAIPRLRQRVVADRWGVSTPRWEDDPLFDPEYHVRRVGVGSDRTQRGLLDLAAPIAEQAFDRDRPPWELHLVDGLDRGRAGVILKIHHAVADGMGLLGMTEALIEYERDPGPDEDVTPPRAAAAHRAGTGAPIDPDDLRHLAEAVEHRARADADLVRRAGGAVRRGMLDLARHPVRSSRRAVDTVGSVGRLVRPASARMSPLLTARSMAVRFDALSASFVELKAAARRVDGTLNDAFMAAVTGGLDRYHRHHGHEIDAVRVNMPINVRTADTRDVAGNRFVPMRFVIPVGGEDPRDRMRVLRAVLTAQRSEPALPLLDGVSGVIARLGAGPATRLLGGMMKAVDITASNVPGPPFPVYASGARIERMIPFGPLAGAAVNITLLSYDGAVSIGVASDPAAVPDPEVLADCLQAAIDEMVAVGAPRTRPARRAQRV